MRVLIDTNVVMDALEGGLVRWLIVLFSVSRL